MPHQCTNCGHEFADGSKEMLSGCPGCGGNKFQFHPSGADGAGAGGSHNTGGSGSTSGADAGVTYADQSEPSIDVDTTTDAELLTDADLPPDADSSAGTDDDVSFAPESHPDPAADKTPVESTGSAGAEDGAQAQARSDVVSPDELPPVPAPEKPAKSDDSDLAALREELNDQFESIKIVEPGQYELNLMGLYDREEYIIALEENGRYVINVPDSWQD